MAKRDPYHHSPRQNYCWCANDAVPWRCPNCRKPENRQRRRQARHAGKREAHEAALDADWICYEHRDAIGDYCFDWIDPIDEPCAVAMPVCSRSLATMADVLT